MVTAGGDRAYHFDKFTLLRSIPLKTMTFHINEFHALRFLNMPNVKYDSQGYVKYHASTRYYNASDIQLDIWKESGSMLVRHAAEAEIAARVMMLCRN
jgi:hypothetical protein